MTCPNCNETLIMSDRNGVEIDYCPKCRGVWLDRGELDKIIERAASYQQSAPTHREFRKQDEYKYKKKRDFLGDLFDF